MSWSVSPLCGKISPMRDSGWVFRSNATGDSGNVTSHSGDLDRNVGIGGIVLFVQIGADGKKKSAWCVSCPNGTHLRILKRLKENMRRLTQPSHSAIQRLLGKR